jgi:hypothetical protein
MKDLIDTACGIGTVGVCDPIVAPGPRFYAAHGPLLRRWNSARGEAVKELERNTTVAEHSVAGTVASTTGHGVSGDNFFTASERALRRSPMVWRSMVNASLKLRRDIGSCRDSRSETTRI